MQPQEIFDKVVDHLFTQGEPAMKPYTVACRYRGDNGQKCAVGCLIPDDLYDTDMEGHSVSDLDVLFPMPDYIVDNMKMLSRLQTLHDMSYSTSTYSKLPFTNEYLNEGFTKIAALHNLSYTPR